MKPRVHLYTVCWNEADMLGYFFRHYDRWVDRYVIHDDGSDDGSLDILRAHPKVELRRFRRVRSDSFVLSHTAMQDEAWKESRGAADWVVVTAIDEHLWVRHRAMADYLAAQQRCGVTLLPALGFDMNHPVMPAGDGPLTSLVTRGRPRPAFNKLSIFNPDAVRETGFGPGRHAAEPVGELRLPARDEVMLWHYKHLGFERNAAREAAQARRLGAGDVAGGLARHYLWSKARLRAFWDEMEQEATDLSVPGFDPARDCAHPLWWEARPGIARVHAASAAPMPAARGEPTVSVLVKAHNHAAYVRQTIESLLEQDFQDFEIVVTDDASTDGTADILRSFDDPRISLEVLPENLGISGAMNATIARARGRYLAILNSDDWALPGRLRRQVAFLDARPEISLVFGLPRPVDEAGAPATFFNDFHRPLRLPDWSRRSWLRHFFLEGNCLCAPTAMIRRRAYEDAGPYDPRLTNLQDFDMWIRMLLRGHAIGFIPEELTAFRIRDGLANMSAPRPDTRLRTGFELMKVLRHFAALDAEVFEEVFGDEAPRDGTATVAQRVAALALRHPGHAHRLFGLDLLHETARTTTDFRRLREFAGGMDVFGILNAEARDVAIAECESERAATRAAAALLEEKVQELLVQRSRAEQSQQALHDAQHRLEESEAARAALAQRLRAIETSTIWRATFPLRRCLARVPRPARRLLVQGARLAWSMLTPHRMAAR